MATDEHARHELYNRLIEQLGADHARTLMEHLPPSGWADIATRRDLDLLRHEFNAALQEVVATLRVEINAQTRLLFFSMIGTMLTAVSLAFAAARLA